MTTPIADVLHAVVEALYIYPVKACAGLRVPSLHFSAQGLIAGDRQWVVVNADAEVVWQGSHPRLALVQPQIAPGQLRLTGPAGAPLSLTDPPQGEPCQIKFWNSELRRNDVFDGIDAGDAAGAWLQQITGAGVRLVRLVDEALVRNTVKHCHITSASSLQELNRSQALQGLRAAEMERFRPNVVLAEGASALAPFIEEYCSHMHWCPEDDGRTAHLSVQKSCIRCIVPNVDPFLATVSNQPLETVTRLSAERHPGQPAYFGIYAQAQHEATLHERAHVELTLNF